MLFIILSIASSIFAFLLLRRKKNAPVWIDLLIAIVSGLVFTSLVVLLGFLFLNSYFGSREH